MGMTIDEAIKYYSNKNVVLTEEEAEANTIALNIMRKYQKFQDQSLSLYMERLKADMVAMLTEIQLEFEENTVRWYVGRVDGKSDDVVLMETINDIIQQKINSLKAKIELQESEDKE